MQLSRHHQQHASVAATLSTATTSQPEAHFCPSMFCFTDELSVRRISRVAVWLITDEQEGNSWVMMGDEPVCPHCGTVLR